LDEEESTPVGFQKDLSDATYRFMQQKSIINRNIIIQKLCKQCFGITCVLEWIALSLFGSTINWQLEN